MKISLNWLKNYVNHGVSKDTLAHKLTMAGLEVEDSYEVKGDTVFELEITPNRADCLNMIGMAREVSAILDKTLKQPKVKLSKLPGAKADVAIQDKKRCERYIGVLIKDVKVGTTSADMKKYLEALGLRSINNVVDITNFSLLENGQPLHAFDYDKLEGGKIVVRAARKGEKIVTIDGTEHKLDPSILVIADAKRPVAIAGVMGGKDTEVTKSTKNILLESAYFDPINIRRTSRKLALSSDSSYRFERGVSFEGVLGGAQRALQLILESTGGKIVGYKDLNFRGKAKGSSKVAITHKQINDYLGADLTSAKCKTILSKLGFNVKEAKKGSFQVTPPEFRSDINQAVDVIEEVARVVGYDNLPAKLPVIKAPSMRPSPRIAQRETIRQTLIGQGFNEVITYSMDNTDNLAKTEQQSLAAVSVKNPLSLDQELMRPSLLASHLNIVRSNVNRGNKAVRFFEAGKIYTKAGEKEYLAAIITDETQSDWRDEKSRQNDFYDLKGVLEQTFTALKVSEVEFVEFGVTKNAWAETGQCASVHLNGKEIGVLGKIKKDVLNAWDIKQGNVYFSEINLENIYVKEVKTPRYAKISEYPAIVHDISLAVGKDITYDQVKDVVSKNSNKLLTDITFKEEYLGDKISSDQRGLVFSLHFQSSERTLVEDEVNKVFEKISQALVDELAAQKR